MSTEYKERLNFDSVVVHCGIDEERYHRVELGEAYAALGIEPGRNGDLTVGMVATFSEWKGLDVFVRAMARVATARERVTALICGGRVSDTEIHTDVKRDLDDLIAFLLAL